MIIDRACMCNRKLKDCEQCCRFNDCKDGKETSITNMGDALKLGMAIVGDVVTEYEKAYRKGHKNKLVHYTNWFKTQQTNILTAENYDGQAILDNLQFMCERNYGKFDDIYKASQERYAERIKTLNVELKKASTNRERKELKKKIRKLQGEKNL